jgi:hypothetical protein
MGIGRHQEPEVQEPEIHPDVLVRCMLGLGLLVVLELAGILIVIWEHLK